MAVDPSIERAWRVVAVAHRHLEERREEINELNVFPVPDGDTGDNMLGTIKAVLDGLEGLRSSELAAVDRNYIVQTVAHSALMGARGNSGVILSQIFRGAAELLTTRRGDLIGPTLVRDALERASEAAWASVADPQEGTMLTVIREVHRAVAETVERSGFDESALVDDATQDAVLAELIGSAIQAGEEAVSRTPEQLDVLGKAGVVDAGGHGLVVILAGLATGLAGHETPSPVAHHSSPGIDHDAHAASRYQYCTSCIVTGRGLDATVVVPALEDLGDSIAVVGDETMLKVHVHTDTPERARELCERHGDVDQFEFTDMRAQIAARGAGLAQAEGTRTGVVAVASGDGVSELFRAAGASVVDGGPTLNPAISDLVAAIDASPAEEVLLLPNSANVILAAEEAARISERQARVIPSTTQQAGLVAMAGFDPAADADENADRIGSELADVVVGLVAEADRDDAGGRYRRGDAVGFAGDELVSWGEPGKTLTDLVAHLARDAEIVTLLEGREAPARAGELGLDADGAELEVLDGGQPTYWWLIAAQ